MKRRVIVLGVVVLLAVAAAACGGDGNGLGEPSPAGGSTAAIEVTSAAFAAGGAIPVGYSCDGGNTPLPIAWRGVPGAARSIVIVFDDPDARGYVHWLLWLPPDASDTSRAAAGGARAGRNSAGSDGYAGPCPPKGSEHHYRIRVFAVDTPLDLAAGATVTEVQNAINGHVIAAGQLAGTFRR